MADEPKRRSPTLTALTAIAVIAVLYVLSAGPAMALHDCNFLESSTIGCIYAPLTMVSKRIAVLDIAIQRYVNLWSDGQVWFVITHFSKPSRKSR